MKFRENPFAFILDQMREIENSGDLCEVFVHLVQADRVAPRPGIQIPMCRFLHGDRLLQ